MAVLFFDIGATLAAVTAGADGSLTFRPLPRVLEVLGRLSDVRKGIISNPGAGDDVRAHAVAALASTFGAYFSDPALVHWGPKATRGIFDEAVASAGARPDDCVFVGEDPDEHRVAREAGLRVAPHPVFTLPAIAGRPVFWVRVDLPAGRTLAELEVVANADEIVPVHVASQQLVLAMATERGVAALEQGGFTADVRGRADGAAAYLMRDDRRVAAPVAFAGAVAEDKDKVEARMRAAAAFTFISRQLSGFTAAVTSLGPAPGGVYVAAPAGTPIEELHIPGAKHGHTERLLPDPALLSRPGEADAASFTAGFSGPGPSNETLDAALRVVTSAEIRGHVARITGIDPLVAGQPLKVRSRDVGSDHNMLVVDALAHRLRDLGLAVRFHEFSFRGKLLANVEAEYRVEGSDAAVLVTAHLDSTAAGGKYFDANGVPRPYDPAIDPAPGADDDGSGTAAVMAAAECLTAIVSGGRRPTRSVRFILFNAEEQGLVGSKVYARAAAAGGDRIAAVLQMDMIGGFQGGARKVEIHAGSAVPGPVVSASNALGALVTQAVAAVAPTLEVERITGASDPAAGRSDHASFHERGWAAVAVSENFFDDTAPATGTRQYHMPGDTLDDPDHNTDYAAEIARAVTVAALTLAGL